MAAGIAFGFAAPAIAAQLTPVSNIFLRLIKSIIAPLLFGTLVALGVVRQGTVKVYDELLLTPNMKPVMIKSIQIHDDPVQSSSSPARVGLAIKGVTAEEISRGDIICSRDAVNISSGPLEVKFVKSPFYKGELAENQMYMLSVGMQIRPARIKNRDGSLEISVEKPLAFQKGQSCVLLKPDNQGTRIIGKGQIQ